MAVKAEAQDSGGAKNVLTREEIAVCDGIIMALPFLLDGGAAGTAAIVTDRLRDTRYLDYTMVKEV